MKLRVLGCHGGDAPGHRATCFMLDRQLLVDCGSPASTLSIAEQAAIDNILLTHSHLDHVKDLAAMADLVIGHRKTPIEVIGPPHTIKTLREHFFNNNLWPDFTAIPTKANPVFVLREIHANGAVQVGNYSVRAVPVHHPVESMAYLIERDGSTVAFSGDTGPTQQYWKELNATPNIRGVFVDVSFPNKLQGLADVSGHLTPATLRSQLELLKRDVPVLPYHLKPAFVPELVREIGELGHPRVSIPQLDDELEF